MMILKTAKGNFAKDGIFCFDDKVIFSTKVDLDKKTSILLFKKNTKEIQYELEFTKEMIIGNMASMTVYGLKAKNFDYAYRVGNNTIVDLYAPKVNYTEQWGKIKPDIITSKLKCEDFDWEDDEKPNVSLEDIIMYKLNVRGFTKSKSSKVNHKGTFLGVVEKIPYLKDLGINMIELMPAYDFNEIIMDSGNYDYTKDYINNKEINSVNKINYWGYTKGHYFSVKSGYAFNKKNPDIEFKNLVKEFHRQNIYVVMDFSFEFDENPIFILDCIKYWVLEYHIDGVNLFANDLVMTLLDNEPVLKNTFIFSNNLSNISKCDNMKMRHLFNYNDEFMNVSRQFLKGDEGQASNMKYCIKNNPQNVCQVNYISNHFTFTLLDMFSYDRKHNVLNGENNKDGSDYNYSWNCGEEGESRKRKIIELRKKLIKNAITILMTAQGIPLIYSGDEIGNTQNGNNNPYCQDNEIGWVDWKCNNFNNEIFAYMKRLITFRKENKILHMPLKLKFVDFLSCGMPDASYHSMSPWHADSNYTDRHFAIMYCGKYAETDNEIYIACNMYWENQVFKLPNPLNKKKWKCVLNTDLSVKSSTQEKVNITLEKNINKKEIIVPPRSIIILKSKKE